MSAHARKESLTVAATWKAFRHRKTSTTEFHLHEGLSTVKLREKWTAVPGAGEADAGVKCREGLGFGLRFGVGRVLEVDGGDGRTSARMRQPQH